MTFRFNYWTAVAAVLVVAFAAITIGREDAAAPPQASPFDLRALGYVRYRHGGELVTGPVYVDEPGEPRLLVGDQDSRAVRAILRTDVISEASCFGYRDNPPTAAQRPYNRWSPFNQPLATRPVHPQSADIVANALSRGVGSLFTEQAPSKEYTHPIYYARADDPVLELEVGRYAIDGHRIPVPAAARPAGGSDAHMSVVTPDCWAYDLWHVRRNGTILEAEIGARQRYDGLGIVTPEMKRYDETIGGTTAPYFGHHAGLIRGPELLAGRIDHALFLVIEFGTADTTFGNGVLAPGANRAGGAGSAVYPAFKGDAVASGVRAPMGARFFLDMTDAEIDATGAPAWEKTIAKAMASYGGYFGDTGGPGFGFAFEAGFQYTTMGLTNPLETVARNHGLTKDPLYGYHFRFSNRIPWSTHLKVTLPPARPPSEAE